MALRERKLGKDDLDARERQDVLHTLANICKTMMRDKRGFVGDVARAVGGSLVAPPIKPYTYGDTSEKFKGFGAVDELVTIITGGVPVNGVATGVDLKRVLKHGNHRCATKHLQTIGKKSGDYVRRQKFLVTQESAAHEIPNLRVSPLAAVVTPEVRIINDFSFAEQRREKK